MRRLKEAGVVFAMVIVLAAFGCGSDAAPAAVSSARGATDTAFQAALDRARRKAHVPGATAAVVSDGALVWTGASGVAVAGPDRRTMTPETLFAIASTTKSVVAAIALRLAEEGELDLDAPIAGLGIEVPGAGRVTPRMLLHHSSGLSDYFADGYIIRTIRRDPNHVWTREEVVSHIHGLDFPPGTRTRYSNSGFVVLGGVIEAASGQSVEALFQGYVADPLALGRSSFAYDAARSSEFAAPHARDGGRWRNRWPDGEVRTDYWGEVWTDGGLAADASELALFGNAMVAGDLLQPASLERALPHGGDGSYGLGLERFDFAGRRWIGHSGYYGGIGTENWTDPASGVTVVTMVNSAGRGFLVWKAIVDAL